VSVVRLYLSVLVLTNAILWGRVSGQVSWAAGALPFSVTTDLWSLRFYSLLGLISGVVVCWAYYYMDGEPHFRRFLSVVAAFVRSIVVLIFMRTLYGALVGWDGLGITSFLLVIYFKNRKALGSGMITALTNRLGDAFLLALLGLSFLPCGPTYVLLILLLLTAMTKRAQYPFRGWLPAAIAAPTPVRALVHSSTLVTAGVYLLIRFNHKGREWLLPIGTITMLMAGMCACAEMDIKKIVALRTLSQLGVMVVRLGLALKNLRFFHLMRHAMFKALLFISVGVGIHTIYGSQDFRRFSNVSRALPFPRALMRAANLALLGFPFLAGFYRKDSILEGYYRMGQRWTGLAAFLLGVGLTAAYSLKLTSLALMGHLDQVPSSLNGGSSPSTVKSPLLVLGLPSILGSYLLAPILTSGVRMTTAGDKLLPLLCIALGGGVGWRLSYVKAPFLSSIWSIIPVFQARRAVRQATRTVQLVDEGGASSLGGVG